MRHGGPRQAAKGEFLGSSGESGSGASGAVEAGRDRRFETTDHEWERLAPLAASDDTAWAWRRWRPSRMAGSGSGWLAMNTWKRCPCWSVKASLCAAPGWGRSRRQIARIPSGQPALARSRSVSSATQAPVRDRPSGSRAGCHACSGRAPIAAWTRWSQSNPIENYQLAAGQFVDEGVGGAGGIGPDQDRPTPHWFGQPKKRHAQPAR